MYTQFTNNQTEGRKFMNSQTIYFDMDGTIANLYGVENWLPQLQAANPAPYAEAEPLLKLQPLARRLNKLQAKGWKLGIISWLAKNSTAEYDKAVTETKLDWLKKHLKSVNWNEIHIVPYGTPKEEIANNPQGILFDDEKRNRDNWQGTAHNEKDIMKVLKAIA